jgi:acyl-CoA synthetase (AMP-forming)/AMP-acid ligase II
VAGEGLEPRELLRHCAKSLPAWQVPRDVWMVSELPVSERGKISRKAIAELYAARKQGV